MTILYSEIHEQPAAYRAKTSSEVFDSKNTVIFVLSSSVDRIGSSHGTGKHGFLKKNVWDEVFAPYGVVENVKQIMGWFLNLRQMSTNVTTYVVL